MLFLDQLLYETSSIVDKGFRLFSRGFLLWKITSNLKGLEKREPGTDATQAPPRGSLGEDTRPPPPQTETQENGRPWLRVQVAVISKLTSERQREDLPGLPGPRLTPPRGNFRGAGERGKEG